MSLFPLQWFHLDFLKVCICNGFQQKGQFCFSLFQVCSCRQKMRRVKTSSSNLSFLCLDQLCSSCLLPSVCPPYLFFFFFFWCVCLHGFWALSNSIWPQQRRRRGEKKHFHMCKLGTPTPLPTQSPYVCTRTLTHTCTDACMQAVPCLIRTDCQSC